MKTLCARAWATGDKAAGKTYRGTEVRLRGGGGGGQPVTVAQGLHGDHASLHRRPHTARDPSASQHMASSVGVLRGGQTCVVAPCERDTDSPEGGPKRGWVGTYGAEHGPAAVDDLGLLEARQGGGVLAQAQGVEPVVAGERACPAVPVSAAWSGLIERQNLLSHHIPVLRAATPPDGKREAAEAKPLGTLMLPTEVRRTAP